MSDDRVFLPKRLTAENGAKYLLSGEFQEIIELACPECDADHPDENCDVCHGHYFYNQPVQISWTTIKEIYKRIVDHYAGLAQR